MKYLYLKDKNMTSLIPVSTVRIYCDNNEMIGIDDIASNSSVLTIRCKNKKWAEMILEDLANWLAAGNENNNVYEINSYDDR